MSVTLAGLEDSFDNEAAEKMLNLSVGKVTYTSALLRKSLYDFDLETPEGIEKLMALIPIMDPEILKDIMTELWPGYPTDIDARRHRMEIKGYLKDYLESLDDPEVAEEQQLLEQGAAEREAEQTQDPAAAGDVEQDPAISAGTAPDAGAPAPTEAEPAPDEAEVAPGAVT